MARPRRRLIPVVATLGLAGGLARCGGSDLTLPGGDGPIAIEKLGGDNQIGPVGGALPLPLVVRVTDRQGSPLPDQSVTFSLDPDVTGASVDPEVAETGEDGRAQASWVLGSSAGTQGVLAGVAGVNVEPVRFEASAGPAEAERIELAGGNGQSAAVGTALENALSVLVTDGFGNPVAGVVVEWSAEDGSVDPASSNTGEDGRASTTWVLGSSAGTQGATASSEGLEGSPVAFSATALPGSADQLVRISGNGQTAQPGERLDDPLVVRLVDRNGNGISGRAVSWVVGSGGGSVDPATSTTSSDGLAETRWTLGSSTGNNTLNAVVSGVGVVSFTATATDGGGGGGGGGDPSPSRLAFRVQPSDVEEDEDISPPVQVEVLDQNGNRFTARDFEIKLELRGDGRGRLRGDETEETRSGIATFDDLEISREGEYRLRASTGGVPPAESVRFEVRDRDRGGGDDD